MGNLFIVSILSMSGLAFLFAGILAFADKKLRVKEDTRVVTITEILPGLNCGACGFLSCRDLAEHIIKTGADPALCRVQSEESLNKICDFVGTKGGTVYPKFPIVHCAAEWDEKQPMARYIGIGTCSGADLVFGGGMECQYGCIGMGDCCQVCPFDALHMEDGLPVVDVGKCTGCGKCAEKCPRKIITMNEKKHEKIIYVACSSHDDIIRTKQVCKVGCIACGICAKLSKEAGYFIMSNNLSHADYAKQKNQGEVAAIMPKCPTKVIKEL